MTIEEENLLKEKLVDTPSDFYRDCNISVCLASEKDTGDDSPFFEQIQMSNAVADRFRSIVSSTIESIENSISSNSLRILGYDPVIKNERDEIEVIDPVDDVILIARFLEILNESPERMFTDDSEFVKKLRFYAILVRSRLGKNMIFFRSYSHSKTLSQAPKKWGIKKHEGYYDEVQETVFTFDSEIDCIYIDETLFILNKDKFHNIFRYYEKLKGASREAVETIQTKIIIHNSADFASMCEGHLQKMQKLRNILNKPHFNEISIENAKTIISNFGLSPKIRIVEMGGNEGLLYENGMDQWVLLKILDDDFLVSEMTKSRYEVNSKHNM